MIFSLIALSAKLQAQNDPFITRTCYETNSNGVQVEVPCDDAKWAWWNWGATPGSTANVDSICHAMEGLFFAELNNWRRKNGLKALTYDKEMDTLLTTPHNQYQLLNNIIEHGEHGTGLQEIAKKRGIGAVYECVAFNSLGDLPGKSAFLEQYKESTPHWSILTSPIPTQMACSVLYDVKLDRFYSTVNLR